MFCRRVGGFDRGITGNGKILIEGLKEVVKVSHGVLERRLMYTVPPSRLSIVPFGCNDFPLVTESVVSGPTQSRDGSGPNPRIH